VAASFWKQSIFYIKAMRPYQWTKNGVVFAAFIFALGDKQQHLSKASLNHALLAAIFFCLMSSAIYLINDIRDRNNDRQHPTKRFRPIAAGTVPLCGASILSLSLIILSLTGSYLLNIQLFAVICTYFIMQLVYTFGLKRVALVDIFVISAGFVLRALAGAVVLHVVISPWLLLCTMLLALFLALCKRRHEKNELGHMPEHTRASLTQYNVKLLDQLISIVSSAVIVCYALYTLWPDTVAKYGTSRLGFTIPFVIFGLFRYLDLVYRHEKGDRPEKILLTDIPLILNLLAYGVTVLAILLIFRH